MKTLMSRTNTVLKMRNLNTGMTPHIFTSTKTIINITKNSTKNNMLPMNAIMLIFNPHKIKTMILYKNSTWITSRNHRKIRTLYINFQDDLSR